MGSSERGFLATVMMAHDGQEIQLKVFIIPVVHRLKCCGIQIIKSQLCICIDIALQQHVKTLRRVMAAMAFSDEKTGSRHPYEPTCCPHCQHTDFFIFQPGMHELQEEIAQTYVRHTTLKEDFNILHVMVGGKVQH